MARDFNQNRNVNAVLGQATIDKYGKTFAIQYGLDGFSSVNNVVTPMPTDIKEYLEGNDDITIFACANNIDKLCEYALMSFPNIEELYLFKTSAIVVLEDDLSYLLDLNKIYVPSNLLSAYISAYPTLSSKFYTIVEDYTLTIPFVGDTTLTTEYVDSVIAMLSSAEKNEITKVVIPTDFSEESANEIAWNYDFSAITNLNNNIWYGNTQYDFSVWTIGGSGTLTSAIVESSISSIPSDKVSGITKVVIPDTFTKMETNCLDICDNYINVQYLDIGCFIGNKGTEYYYQGWSNSNNTKFIYVNYTKTNVGFNALYSCQGIKKLYMNNLINVSYYQILTNGRISELELNSLEKVTNASSSASFVLSSRSTVNILMLNELIEINGNLLNNGGTQMDIYMPKIQTISTTNQYNISGNIKDIYIGTNNCVLGNTLKCSPQHIYIPRGSLSYYQNATNWSNYSSLFEEYDY